MYLITGANGQLGTELRRIMPANQIITPGHADLDITDLDSLKKITNENDIKTIINCAAYTAVDKAESDKENAYRINTLGPKNLAMLNVPVIHISTDYVFDGTTKRPLHTTDKTNPLSVYGKTKLDGEKMVLEYAPTAIVIRTSWLYSPFSKNFLTTMQKLGQTHDKINVVSDQFGTPTYATDLAYAIVKILPQIQKGMHKIYHYSNLGVTSWYDFACEIMKLSKLNCVVNPILTSQYPTPAKRPSYTVMDKTEIIRDFRICIPQWRDALARCIARQQRQK